MSRKKENVRYNLDSGDVKHLSTEEIKAILRAADELVAMGGRNMLAKILKGSKEKKVLEYGLNQCPVYGYYKDFTISEITSRIDWVIEKGYLQIEYRDRLPMLIFSESGWMIEQETFAGELLQKIIECIETKDYSLVSKLKDRNREMIFLLIDKIKSTGNIRFIPFLKAWKEIEVKKVQAKIQWTIEYLMKEGTIY